MPQKLKIHSTYPHFYYKSKPIFQISSFIHVRIETTTDRNNICNLMFSHDNFNITLPIKNCNIQVSYHVHVMYNNKEFLSRPSIITVAANVYL